MTEPLTKTITVSLAEVPTDVLVWLVDHGPANEGALVAEVVPPDTEHGRAKIAAAMMLLLQMGYVERDELDWDKTGLWLRATDDGHAAVERARRSTP